MESTISRVDGSRIQSQHRRAGDVSAELRVSGRARGEEDDRDGGRDGKGDVTAQAQGLLRSLLHKL